MTDIEPMDMPEIDQDWDGFTGAQTDLEDQSLHPATLSKLTKKILPSAFSESGKAPAIIWTFTLDSGTTVDGTSSEATGPKSKARPWLEAMLGKTTTKEMLRAGALSKSVLIGKRCQVLISINDNGYPKVSTVLPYNGPQAPAAPQAAPSATPVQSAAPEPSSEVQQRVPRPANEEPPGFDDLPF